MEMLMDKAKPTAATFRDPLLKVLGSLTNLVPGAEVDTDTALAAVYEETGYTEDEFGAGDANRPYVRVVAVRAFNRMLKRDGLAENRGRGVWALTPEGVQVASLLIGPPQPEEGELIELPPKEHTIEEDFPEVPLASHGGGVGVSWTLGPQINNYNDDPYIQGLAIKMTHCFGKLSERSDKCKTCPISGSCKAAVLGTLSDLSETLRKRDEVAMREALAPPPPEPTPEPKAENNGPDPDEMDIDEILNIINEDAEGEGGGLPAHTMMEVPAGSTCEECHKEIQRGQQAAWVQGEGMYHPDCFKAKHQGGPQGTD